MSDIFLSYAHEDRETAERLAQALESKGWSVWWDPDIRRGTEFDRVIEAEIAAARCVVVLWSEHSLESRWVRAEAGEGADRNLLVPVTVSEVKQPLAFRNIQASDLAHWDGTAEHEEFVALSGDIAAKLSGDTAPPAVDSSPRRPAATPAVAGWRRWAGPAAIALIAVAFAIWWVATRDQTPEAPVETAEVATTAAATGLPTLAVLPLRPLGDDEHQQLLAQGLTSSLHSTFASLPGLRVASRGVTTASDWAGVPNVEIGKRLGVDHFLRGEVQRGDGSWMIIAELNPTDSEFVSWSESYDVEESDIVNIQRQVARAVADDIELRLTPEAAERLERETQVDADAYDLYLEGFALLDQRSPASITQATELLESAVERAPDLAPAWARLADAYRLHGVYGLTLEALRDKSQLAAARAVELEPDLAEAHATRGDTLHLMQWDRPGAEEAYRRAIALNPDFATARQWYAQLLVLAGRSEEGLEQIELAMDLEPDSPVIRSTLTNMYFLSGRLDEAVAKAEASLEAQPGFWLHHADISLALSARGDHQQALEHARQGDELSDGSIRALVALGAAAGNAGDVELARQTLARLDDPNDLFQVAPTQRAWVLAAMGDREAALEALSVAMSVRDSWLMLVPFLAEFRFLEETAEGRAVLEFLSRELGPIGRE